MIIVFQPQRQNAFCLYFGAKAQTAGAGVSCVLLEKHPVRTAYVIVRTDNNCQNEYREQLNSITKPRIALCL